MTMDSQTTPRNEVVPEEGSKEAHDTGAAQVKALTGNDDHIDGIESPEDLQEAVRQMQRQARAMLNKPSLLAPVEFIAASSIQAKPIEWVFDELIPSGMISILAGKAGEGKTNLALWMASLVSRENSQFNGKPVKHGRVLIWSGEDAAEYVLIPRLRAFGADMDKIDLIGRNTMDTDGRLISFSIAEDLPLLEQSINNRKGFAGNNTYTLLILDPIIATVRKDMNQANIVRQALDPLRELAENQNVAVLGITHFSKGGIIGEPQDKVIGSQAFTALSRMTLGLVRDSQTDNRRLVILKTNITDDRVGYEFSYTFTTDDDGCGVPRIELLGALQGSARQLMAEIAPEETAGAVADAMAFLKGILYDAPLTAKQIEAEARGAGHSWDAIRRAAQKLGIQKRKDTGPNGKWRWALPSD